MSSKQVPWFEKPALLGLLTLVLPLIAMAGIYLNKKLDSKFRIALLVAALANFLGQMALVVLFLVMKPA
jgi:hypothetical protein